MVVTAVEILSRFKIIATDKENLVKPVYGFITKPEKEVLIDLQADDALSCPPVHKYRADVIGSINIGSINIGSIHIGSIHITSRNMQLGKKISHSMQQYV